MSLSNLLITQEDLTLIIETQQAIATAALDLNFLMNLIAERAQVLTHAQGAVVEMVEGDEMVYRGASGSAISSLGARLKISSSLSGHCIRSSEVIYCEDSEIDSRVDIEACRRIGVRSMIVVPLQHERVNVGVLKVLSDKASSFTEREMQILKLIAGLLSASISRAKALQMATAATTAKTEFLANMSHEIRTPINGMMGMAHLMTDTPLNVEQKIYLDAILSSADSLLTIVNDILDFSKIESGKIDFENIPFQIAQIFHDIESLVTHIAKPKKLDVKFSLSPEVPEYVAGDPTRLKQVVLNLVSNAIKFTEKGSVEVSARLGSSPHTLHFSVKDSGIGISEEAQKKLFQSFTQADSSTTRKFGGTGLGLSICKRLVNLMNGHIGLSSKENEGSTFWFVVPLSAVEAPFKIPAPKKSEIPENVKLRVLVAEDNKVNQVIALRMLEKLGHTVSLVENGREAIQALEKSSFDLVLMDCQMPELDGLSATQEIRCNLQAPFRGVQIVAMTANAMEGDRKKCIEAGMDDYLSKPFKGTELDAIIARAIERLQDKSYAK